MEGYSYENKSAIHNDKVFDDIKESIGLKTKELRSKNQMIQQKLTDIFRLSRNHLAQVKSGLTIPL